MFGGGGHLGSAALDNMPLRWRIEHHGTEAEKRLSILLFDEFVHAVSTFDMNSIASLSYGNETCDQIFDVLTEVLSRPLDFPMLVLQKSLAVTKHLLIYGSNKCIHSCYATGIHVKNLKDNYNTVLMTQKQNGIGKLWHNMKGGAVDKGFPIRQAAEELHKLLEKTEIELQTLRNDKADPNSLVPVGSNKSAAFVSDELRHYMLKKRMDQQNLIRTKSNLAKADKGWGSGYTGKDGKNVVGAAHGLEEMLARAAKEEKKFTETGPVHYKAPNTNTTNTTKPKKTTTTTATNKNAAAAAPVVMDLLDFQADAPATVMPQQQQQQQQQFDLLDMAAPTPDPFAPEATTDFLGGINAPTQQTNDLFGMMSLNDSNNPNNNAAAAAGGIFGTTTSAPITEGGGVFGTAPSSIQGGGGIFGTAPPISPTEGGSVFGNNAAAVAPSQPPPPPVVAPSMNATAELSNTHNIMSSNEDRFAALDALTPPTTNTVLSGKEAENRILSFSSNTNTAPSQQQQQPPDTMPPPPPPTSMPPQPPTSMPPQPPMPAAVPAPSYSFNDGTTTLGVAETYGDKNNDDDDDDGFVMGGTSGTGLHQLTGPPSFAMPAQPTGPHSHLSQQQPSGGPPPPPNFAPPPPPNFAPPPPPQY